MTWILCYDIEEDSLRQKLARRLEKYGWERLQKSVFVLTMPHKEWNRHYKVLSSYFECRLKPADKIYVWGMNAARFKAGRIMGSAYDARWILGEYVVYYRGEEELLK